MLKMIIAIDLFFCAFYVFFLVSYKKHVEADIPL